jgi:hypothetical protein
MLIEYHESITRKALSERFSPHALQAVLAANLKQDNLLTGQVGHNEYHYDNNAIAESNQYVEKQRRLTLSALQDEDLLAAWAAFGRLTHTAQDFYAHSNYVDLWLSQFDNQALPPPPEIAPLLDKLLQSPNLHSGKLYYPLGVLSFVPFVKRFVIPLLPADSHAHMQLDSPACGERFAYAFEAAVKRTQYEFETTAANLSTSQKTMFRGES